MIRFAPSISFYLCIIPIVCGQNWLSSHLLPDDYDNTVAPIFEEGMVPGITFTQMHSFS